MTLARERIAAARSFLFVPGHRPDRFAKAAASAADVVIVDLEDAVAAEDKDRARCDAAEWLEQGGDCALRINPPGTAWFEDDLATAVRHGCPVVVPKAEAGPALCDVGRRTRGLIPLVETASGVERAAELCATAGTVRVALGNVDLAGELGAAPDDRAALAYARSRLVFASAAAGLAQPIDGVTIALDDTAVLEGDVAHARRLGFGGKLCVHPGQVPVVSDGFAPSESEREWARAVVGAGDSVTHVGGQMVDKPVLERARRIMAARNGNES
ncbi:citrate lyase subunit beta/citryl-CoA lyase [Saccharopolyspora erythraea NRRL 2338]|uniref:Citrate lyase beta subunit n=2 Tax=Saccharopolyspora erythraea TaxID=1836 RepID=A4FIH5_SACEN|nr:CoA ester lyase [Saccharopolyspora erythraea]EQD87867.1 citrate lyase [Saccharopolyspora erythraea D]PFG97526.1 citrate lyase subunit beta/citryl-CoA lyase [Saccharopolyspora erythraea NRRL 2338]QRK87700.1 CoA ester lyase [Saccharopolyspora erythraea]CAM03850.1 citrate lyase beta subunit [Saccharopolyspora erythraea NRRL 2338]